VAPPEFHQILPTLWVWHAYDSSVKAELFSTALLVQAALYIIDPTRLSDDQLAALTKFGPIAGIIVTNANHHRAAVGDRRVTAANDDMVAARGDRDRVVGTGGLDVT